MRDRIIMWGVPFFFFLLPWQTRYIFGSVLIEGQPTEFGVLSVYATQVFLIALVLFGGLPVLAKRYSHLGCSLWLVLAPAVFSLVFALELRLVFLQIFFLLCACLLFLTVLDERVSPWVVAVSFSLGLVIPVFLGVTQVVMGSNGASMVLGLSAHHAEQLGEAVTGFFGGRTLRAYGGFSHPNVFGGYLSVAILLLSFFRMHVESHQKKIAVTVLIVLLLVGLFLTFSQSAWCGLFVAVLLLCVERLVPSRWAARSAVCIVVFSVVASFLYLFAFGLQTPSSPKTFEQRSVIERVNMYKDFVVVMKEPRYWMTGTGALQYPFALAQAFPGEPWWRYQPMHNSFLLLLGEGGLIGCALLMIFLKKIGILAYEHLATEKGRQLFALHASLLFPALFDHYLWSSWSGLVLVALVCALSVRFHDASL